MTENIGRKNAPQIGYTIGDLMPSDDAHAGCSYAGEDEEGELWLSIAPERINHYDGADWAKQQGGSLPTRREGKYLDSAKGKLANLFNLSGSFPEGYIWLAEPDTYSKKYAWVQDLSTGNQNGNGNRMMAKLPVLCVRR
jgi:hypothetical protein